MRYTLMKIMKSKQLMKEETKLEMSPYAQFGMVETSVRDLHV